MTGKANKRANKIAMRKAIQNVSSGTNMGHLSVNPMQAGPNRGAKNVAGKAAKMSAIRDALQKMTIGQPPQRNDGATQMQVTPSIPGMPTVSPLATPIGTGNPLGKAANNKMPKAVSKRGKGGKLNKTKAYGRKGAGGGGRGTYKGESKGT